MNPTFGVEHEWGDFDLRIPLPKGFGRDKKDITIVNSNGIANDPTGQDYQYGGELLTPPSKSAEGQVQHLKTLKQLLPNAVVNYRSNLHIHLGVPGLREDLRALKSIQLYIHRNMRQVLAQIEPIPHPDPTRVMEYEGAMRRWRRRRVSHHTLLTPERLQWQLEARTVKEFFEREVPTTKAGKPMWHAQPRLCVNLRHLREDVETIEFRHFPGTLDADELEACLTWCYAFLGAAEHGRPIVNLLKLYAREQFPKFPEYHHWMERRYRATVHDGTVPRETIRANIKKILEGTFV